MTLTLTAPAVHVTTHPDTVAAQRRSRLIQATGAALRDAPDVCDLRGRMTPDLPRTVWMHFSFTDDPTPYCLTFPTTEPRLILWMRGLFRLWEPLHTWALADVGTGEDVLAAVRAVIQAPHNDVLHRWLDEPWDDERPVWSPGGLP